MIINVSSLRKSFQGIDLLKDITFQIDNHDKMAIIGVNGAGKSTLMRILCNEESYDSGEVHISNQTRIGYLSQHNSIDPELTIYQALLEVFKPLIEKEKRLRELELKMAEDYNPQVANEYDQLSYEFDRDGGYSYQSRITGIIKGLGFTDEEKDYPIKILSGGQKTRVSLGRLLLLEPDLLLLDEPTNHLDVHSIEWLEGYLKTYSNAILLVSHDRFFIDAISTSIFEIENGRGTLYKCKYDEYAKIKKHNREVDLKHYINNQKEIKRMQDSIDTLKSYNREKQVKRAESKEKALEKMEKLDRPDSLPEAIRIQFQTELESGFDVLSVKDLAMSFETPLFDNISFEVKKGQRVALIGENGIGKTTLFHILNRELMPTGGKFKIGSKVMMSYYDQEHESLTLSKTIFQEVQDTYPRMNNTEIRSACAAFQFKGEDVFKTIDMLSGGERGRVVLLKLLLSKSNFLILDEPTNHLDLESKEVLEDALLSYEGTILFISHDRYFINKLATNIVEMTSHDVKLYDGNYVNYMLEKNKPVETKQENTTYLSNKEENARKRKVSNQIKKVEENISSIEEKIVSLKEELQKEEVIQSYKKYNEITDEIALLNSELEELMMQWESLSEEL